MVDGTGCFARSSVSESKAILPHTYLRDTTWENYQGVSLRLCWSNSSRMNQAEVK